ncbi:MULTISPECIES: hypothetical protein [Streptomyces]|uniref:Transposase n=1 Tax=Streptomyces galilaeus TaxID=33899 RepID=A0ABW9IMW0_STRGJ
MSLLDHLIDESIPQRPTPAPATPPTHRYWTTTEQDQHWQDLCKAVGTPGKPRPSHTAA